MNYIHLSYDIKQPYLVESVLENIKTEFLDGLIDTHGAQSGSLIEIRCPNACISNVRDYIASKWIRDETMGQLLQTCCLEIRVYDINYRPDGFSLKFMPSKPYKLSLLDQEQV